MINISDIRVGDEVHYQPEHYLAEDEWENGIVKEIRDSNMISVWVVYNCAGNWDRYRDYTGALTNLSDLNLGWRHHPAPPRSPQLSPERMASFRDAIIPLCAICRNSAGDRRIVNNLRVDYNIEDDTLIYTANCHDHVEALTFDMATIKYLNHRIEAVFFEGQRDSGRTTRQMREAPRNAVYVWHHEILAYPRGIEREINRNDLTIVGPSWLDGHALQGRINYGIVVDHAAQLTRQQQIIADEIKRRANVSIERQVRTEGHIEVREYGERGDFWGLGPSSFEPNEVQVNGQGIDFSDSVSFEMEPLEIDDAAPLRVTPRGLDGARQLGKTVSAPEQSEPVKKPRRKLILD